MRAQKELNALRIQGTMLDRRRKTSAIDRRRIIYLYNNRKKNGLTVGDISAMYGIHVSNVYRYIHYKRFLKQCRVNSLRYIHKNCDNKIFKKRQKMIHIDTAEYKTSLLDVRDTYSNKIVKLGE